MVKSDDKGGIRERRVRPVLMPYTCAERGVRALPMSGLATSRGGRKKCMVSRRDARSRRSAAWSRSRGPSGTARGVPGARRTSPASRASGQSSRRRARSGPARPSGVRARRQGPAPARARSSRRRPSMISSDFEQRVPVSPRRVAPRKLAFLIKIMKKRESNLERRADGPRWLYSAMSSAT